MTISVSVTAGPEGAKVTVSGSDNTTQTDLLPGQGQGFAVPEGATLRVEHPDAPAASADSGGGRNDPPPLIDG